MKTLLIDHYAGTPDLGMEYRPYYMAREWVRLGHDVTIVAASQSHVRAKQPAGVGFSKVEYIDGIRYIWLRTPRYTGSGLGRILNMGTFLLHLALRTVPALRERDYNAVIASSTYPLDSIPAHWIAKRCGAKFVFELHDLWPLSPMELGGYSPTHPFIRIMQWGEDYYCKHADAVVSILPGTREHLKERGLLSKWLYIPNGIILDEWRNGIDIPESHSKILRTFKERYPFLLGYAGTVGQANALNDFLDAADSLNRDIGLVVVGQGPCLALLKQKFGAKSNVLFLDPVPKKSVPELLHHFDAAYIGWHKQSLYRFGISANKLYDYMAAAVPILHCVDAYNDPVAEAGCGLSVPPENKMALIEAIHALSRMTTEQRTKLGAAGYEYVTKHHDYTQLARIFLDVLQCGSEKQFVALV